MIEALKEKLLPAIKEVVPEMDWPNIDRFFDKVYVIKYTDTVNAYVIGYWGDPNPVIAFDTQTYEFIGIATQEFTIEHGILLHTRTPIEQTTKEEEVEGGVDSL